MKKDSKLHKVPALLLDWYTQNARELPWRVGPAARKVGERPNPYPVWLCEIMMQQTTIPHGTPYFHKFLARWPSVEALAAAETDEVMAAWAGLGYYARARNLHKCAKEVAERGGFPSTEAELLKLPGIGPYTAGAIAAIVYDAPGAAAVDGNVERVMSRLLAAKGEWKAEKKRITQKVREMVPDGQSGVFAEAFMDLGATICTPSSPSCDRCPLVQDCRAFKEGDPLKYPIKPKKAKLPQRFGQVFVLKSAGNVLVERRAERGLLGGMLGLPTSEWESEIPDFVPPIKADWRGVGQVRHVFTHFALTLEVYAASLAQKPEKIGGRQWLRGDDRSDLPSVFAKALNLASHGKDM